MSDLDFLGIEPIEHEVNGKTKHFYPISLRALHAIRPFAEVISQALSVAFTDRSNDVAMERIADPKTGTITKIATDGMAVDLASQRAAQLDRAIRGLLTSLLDEKNSWVFGMLVMDSMKDDFPEFRGKRKEAESFMETRGNAIPFPLMIQMLGGVAKASGGMFDPFGLQAKMQEVLANMSEEPETPGIE